MIDHQKRLMSDKTKGDATPTCRLVAAGKEFAGKQGSFASSIELNSGNLPLHRPSTILIGEADMSGVATLPRNRVRTS
jgi:hypothetical protein